MTAREPADHGRFDLNTDARVDGADHDRLYDSFLVRCWRDPRTRRLLRTEVTHVQTGAVAGVAGAPLDWVLASLRSCLDDLSDPLAPPGRVDESPEAGR